VNKKIVWLGMLLLLLLWPTASVFADEPGIYFDGGQIYVDEDVSLEPGETFDGDLGVFDGDLSVPEGSTVEGDVFIVDGDADIAGVVSGDVAVFGGKLNLVESGRVEGDVFVMAGDLECAGHVEGNLSVMFGDGQLRDSSVVDGDVMIMGGSMERESGAQILGEEMPEIPLPNLPLIPPKPALPEMPSLPEMPEMPEVPDVPEWTRPSYAYHQETVGQRVGRFVGRVVGTAFLSVIFVILGLLIVFVWPRNAQRVADCVATMPLQSFGLGLLTFLIAAVLEALAMVLMIIIVLVSAALISTVILIPIGLLLIVLSVVVLLPVPVAMIGALVLGWVALAQLVGRLAVKALNVGYVKPLGATLVGMLITVPLAALLWIIKPLCCAWPFIILFTSLGVGAVIHTRFGKQHCQQGRPPTEPDLLPAEAMDEEAGEPDKPLDETP
jgi:cytoskeletal protein CcmA (bactofilin family)